MLNFDSLATFIAIANTGSFTETARQLAVAKSVVSARLKDLERSLGAKLVHRTTRPVALTADGATFYERAKRILREAELGASELADRRGTVAGPLRISAPVSFGYLHLGPALFGFAARYPGIELTVDLEDRFVDLLDEGYDAVVRHGPVNGKRLIVKPVATSKRVLVASPSYLKRWGRPASLEDLKERKGIIYSYRGGADWRFRADHQRRLAGVLQIVAPSPSASPPHSGLPPVGLPPTSPRRGAVAHETGKYPGEMALIREAACAGNVRNGGL